MSTGPFQPIPETTQHHVDRLVGATVDAWRVLRRVGEGRYGTLYAAAQVSDAAPVTLQVLRTELIGRDEEVRAVNAFPCAGIATVTAFGELPDGRRYRIMEPLGGESLATALERQGRLSPRETVLRLAAVATALEASHAWALVHGCLGPSSVLVEGDGVKLIDFGLSKRLTTPNDDLKALGALGFSLLSGQEFGEGSPPPRGTAWPEPLDRLLRDLCELRVPNVTTARRELEGVLSLVSAEPAGAGASSRLGLLVAGVGAVAVASLVTFAVLRRSPAEVPAAAVAASEPAPVLPVEVPAVEPAEAPAPALVAEPEEPGPSPSGKAPPVARKVPSATALAEEVGRLEARLRKQARPGDDLDQALFMLNKQRLRLTGSPSAEERLDVARQLAGWRRSYLLP